MCIYIYIYTHMCKHIHRYILHMYIFSIMCVNVSAPALSFFVSPFHQQRAPVDPCKPGHVGFRVKEGRNPGDIAQVLQFWRLE